MYILRPFVCLKIPIHPGPWDWLKELDRKGWTGPKNICLYKALLFTKYMAEQEIPQFLVGFLWPTKNALQFDLVNKSTHYAVHDFWELHCTKPPDSPAFHEFGLCNFSDLSTSCVLSCTPHHFHFDPSHSLQIELSSSPSFPFSCHLHMKLRVNFTQ